jgi:dipeptidyl-peptidase-4
MRREWQDLHMTESFPRQEARTRRFTLGVPRAFRVSPDGARVAYLRTQGGSDPVTCLWVLDTSSGQERLAVDPRTLGGEEENLPAAERARRERVREQAGGIVAYAADANLAMAAFAWSGRVYAIDLTDPRAVAVQVPTQGQALDPRPDPTGRRLAYVSAGALRVTGLPRPADGTGPGHGGEPGHGDEPGHGGEPTDGEPARELVLANPDGDSQVTFGLAEFIAAEEMDRHRGYWWSPDGSAVLTARVDESPVTRWHIADPANPERPPAEVGYPAAGTPNADVSLLLVRLDGSSVAVDIDRTAFPYLVTACWEGEHNPLAVVQSRDQRTMRLVMIDASNGRVDVLREDTDPRWLEIVPGVPTWTGDGRIVWTTDEHDTRRLLIATPWGGATPVTPPGLQVRGVIGVDGDTVLFQASTEPTEVGLWTYGPDGLTQVSASAGITTGVRAGGTTVVARRDLDHDGVTVQVYRDGKPVAEIPSLAEHPALPAPGPVLLRAGAREIRTAVLFPSSHQPGQGQLPVLLDPYGGPHAQRVLKARGTYLTPQWFAEQGFAVVIADGRGTPGRGPQWERAVAGDLAGPVLDDQIEALQAAAGRFADLDTGRVAIRGWSFGGYLAALAVLSRPDVFHAAIAGAPVTDWRLYDTHYTERYLGQPDADPGAYRRSGLSSQAERSVAARGSGTGPGRADAVSPRPLMLIHGLADDNVVVAHTLRLSAALLAAGYPHTVLPLSGITHMASQETVAENLLLLQLDFLRRALGVPSGQQPAGPAEGVLLSPPREISQLRN